MTLPERLRNVTARCWMGCVRHDSAAWSQSFLEHLKRARAGALTHSSVFTEGQHLSSKVLLGEFSLEVTTPLSA